MFGGQWASGVWGPLWNEESICTGSWSNTGCGNPRRVRKAFSEEGGPTQGVRAQEGLRGLPSKNQVRSVISQVRKTALCTGDNDDDERLVHRAKLMKLVNTLRIM